MSIKSIDSFTGENIFQKSSELLFDDCSFDEKEFRNSNLSPSTDFSTGTECCKLLNYFNIWIFLKHSK